MPATSEMLTKWAAEPSGFVWVEPRGWVSVQGTAAAYLTDIRRLDDPVAWEESAQRFIESVAASSRWCSDPDETEMLDSAQPLPIPLPWEDGASYRPRRRTA